MTKREIVQTCFICDVCHQECDPVAHISIPFAYNMDLVNTIELPIRVRIPYATDNGHICSRCLHQNLKEYVEQLGRGLQA